MIHKHKETIDSAVSYGLGGSGVTLATVVDDVSGYVQFAILIVSLLVVLMRAVHDGVKLYRFLKAK